MMAPIVLATALALAREFGPEMLSGRLAGPRRKEIARIVIDTAAQMTGQAKAADPAAVVQAIEADPAKTAAMRLELAALERAERELELRDRIHARETWAALPEQRRGRAPLLIIALFVIAGAVARRAGRDRDRRLRRAAEPRASRGSVDGLRDQAWIGRRLLLRLERGLEREGCGPRPAPRRGRPEHVRRGPSSRSLRWWQLLRQSPRCRLLRAPPEPLPRSRDFVGEILAIGVA